MILKTSAVRGNMLTGNVLPRSKLTIDTICPHYIWLVSTALASEMRVKNVVYSSLLTRLDVVSRINHFSSILGQVISTLDFEAYLQITFKYNKLALKRNTFVGCTFFLLICSQVGFFAKFVKVTFRLGIGAEGKNQKQSLNKKKNIRTVDKLGRVADLAYYGISIIRIHLLICSQQSKVWTNRQNNG